jgi:hypothetical protein
VFLLVFERAQLGSENFYYLTRDYWLVLLPQFVFGYATCIAIASATASILRAFGTALLSHVSVDRP